MTVIEQDTEYESEVIDASGDGNMLAVISRAEIDQQISTAKKYPRSIALAKRRMVEMATLDQETAKSCGYALKRTDKFGKIVWIEGPSIRMAEIAVSCWGNLRYGARVIDETDRFIVAQGVCHDLETNVYNAIEVRRRITGKNGRKYGDDMVGVTANAACAIAQRNAVFKVVPRAIINPAYDAAMRTASGDEKTFGARRNNAMGEFKKLGVKVEEIIAVLGKPATAGIEDVDTTDLRRLHGLLTAINDGETTVDQVFRPQTEASEKTAEINDKLKAAAAAKVTSRPVDSKQTFEPAPEAIAEAAAQTAAEPDTGPDAGGPIVGEQPGEVTGEQQGEQPVMVATWDETLVSLQEAAMDAELPESDLYARVNLWVLAHRCKGKEAEKTKVSERLALVAAVREGRLAPDGKVIAKT